LKEDWGRALSCELTNTLFPGLFLYSQLKVRPFFLSGKKIISDIQKWQAIPVKELPALFYTDLKV
jgi:hypothetical protein